MIVAARGGFPVTVQRVREKLGDRAFVWERWEMEDTYQVFFRDGICYDRVKAGGEQK